MPRGAHGHTFASLAEVMAKANEPKSGDELAGIAAADGAERVAAAYRRGFSRSLNGAPFLLPSEDSALRVSLDEWFQKQGTAWQVKPELRALVSFDRHNLRDEDWRFSDSFDCVFCRNVMIYFDKPTQRDILERFVPLLAPDGLLFCGHSENFVHARDLFHLEGKTVYRPAYAAAARAA